MIQVLGDPQQNGILKRINKLQKRVEHIILKVDYITPSVEMRQRLRWILVSQRIN